MRKSKLLNSFYETGIAKLVDEDSAEKENYISITDINEMAGNKMLTQ